MRVEEDFKKGGKLGQEMGALKGGRTGSPLLTMLGLYTWYLPDGIILSRNNAL